MSNNDDSSSDGSTAAIEQVESSKVVGNDVDHDENHHHEDDVVRDMIMRRGGRGKFSAAVLAGVTALWLLLQVYHFKFIPLASWLAMAFVSLLFLHGSLLKFFGRELPKIGEWEIREERAKEMAIAAKRMMEKGIRWMFQVSCEREWYIFGGVVSFLLLLAYLGHHFHLLTLLYVGTVVGMTMPVLYKKREKEMKAFGDRLRKQASRVYHEHDKVFSKLKPKQKKVE